MKVKVTRTVDLEEIPKIVEKIVSECRNLLLRTAEDLHVTMHDVPNMLKSFIKITEELNLAEVKLEDAVNIITGWHQVQHSPPEVESEPGIPMEKEDE